MPGYIWCTSAAKLCMRYVWCNAGVTWSKCCGSPIHEVSLFQSRDIHGVSLCNAGLYMISMWCSGAMLVYMWGKCGTMLGYAWGKCGAMLNYKCGSPVQYIG